LRKGEITQQQREEVWFLMIALLETTAGVAGMHDLSKALARVIDPEPILDPLDHKNANEIARRLLPNGGIAVWADWERQAVLMSVLGVPRTEDGPFYLNKIVLVVSKIRLTAQMTAERILADDGHRIASIKSVMKTAEAMLVKNYDISTRRTDPKPDAGGEGA
jgi:hypothetical protein